MPSSCVSLIHFILTINCSVKQKCFQINLYKTLPPHSTGGWETFWQTAGAMQGWQHICQTRATQKRLALISPSECISRFLSLHICVWHHCDGSHHKPLHALIRDRSNLQWVLSNNQSVTTLQMGKVRTDFERSLTCTVIGYQWQSKMLKVLELFLINKWTSNPSVSWSKHKLRCGVTTCQLTPHQGKQTDKENKYSSDTDTLISIKVPEGCSFCYQLNESIHPLFAG